MFYDTRKNDHGLPRDPFKAIVAPRPIGWITSMSAKGEINLAPYSFFNAVSDEPPIVLFSSEGRKDSLVFIEETGEFVCNLATFELRAAVVATSAQAFTIVKLAGALVLILLGLQSLRRGRATGRPVAAAPPSEGALRDGLVTSLANPKLAVFYVALFPQFVPAGEPVLPWALAMAALVVAFDLVWYSVLAYLVARARRAFVEGPWLRRAERLTGAVLVGLGVRLAFERR